MGVYKINELIKSLIIGLQKSVPVVSIEVSGSKDSIYERPTALIWLEYSSLRSILKKNFVRVSWASNLDRHFNLFFGSSKDNISE